MLEYRRGFRRFHRSIWGALALLLVFTFLLQNVAGTSYYSLLMASGTAVSPPPVELEEGTVGSSTIYENKTSALVSVEPSGAGTDVEDYVDNNTSDVDNSTDKGTHSNFENEKAKDNNYDTLTETSTAFEWLNCNAYSSTYTAWTTVGTSPYLGAQDQPTNYVYEAVTAGDAIGWFDFPSTTLTGSLYVNISIYCNNDDGAGGDWADVYVDYTGSGAGTDVGNVGQHTGWLYDTIVLGTRTVSEINNLRVYFVYQKVGGAAAVRIDHVRVGVSINCELDLEVQWTGVDYDEEFELLCIYGGNMGAEDLKVDVWYNSAWQTVRTKLLSGWNNVSVGSYLTSSNFTIRFKGGAESGDTTQHTWEIDAVLLHVWSRNEILGSATTVTTDAKIRSVSYGKDRAVLRTTDPNNTLHVFQIESASSYIYWWKSTDNGQTWSKQISSGISPVASFSVKKDSNNYIHLVTSTGTGGVFYRKQLYNATSWGSSVAISTLYSYQGDVAIAPYSNSWVYVVYDYHSTTGAKENKIYVKISTNGGSSFGSAIALTYNEYVGGYTAGTFPSIVIHNTLGTYGHIYVTWFRADTNLYLRKGQINSNGSVTWDADSNVQTISSSMSTASTTENTNMMHSAMYANGKYRVVYCESGTAKYRHWDESSWSSPISLATVSNYPSITYDWNNYIYVFYHTNVINAQYDIRYMRSADTTPTVFGNAQNVTANNEGNRYVSAKLGGDNNRVEFAWTYGTSSPYQVKYNCIKEGGAEGDFDYVLKGVEKDNSDWKVRLKAYDDTSKGRLDNCTMWFYGESQPITNMNFTTNANGWNSSHTSNGTEVTWTEVTWDSGNGNPSPGSAGGSAYGGASESSTGKNLGTVIYNFSYTFTAPVSGWTSVTASFAWKFNASGTYGNNILNSVKLLLTDNSDAVLEELYVDDNGGSGWSANASVGYYYRTGITVSASMTAGNTYKLKVQFRDTDTVNADNPSLTFRIDDVGITFNYPNSNQIIITSGSYTNQTGPWYDLAANGTIYIAMHVETSEAGTSYIYVYLEIRVPNKTVYARYIITFKIN